jgi:hypothetical protein
VRHNEFQLAEGKRIGKEVNTVKYEKPEIAVVGSAIEAVQNSMIKQAPPLDSPTASNVAAYESDEA